MSNTKKPTVSMICALAENRVIGRDNGLIWHIPRDMRRFKSITKGHPVIMGRKTYESIGRPLPGRLNIVITRDPAYAAEGCVVVHSLDGALQQAYQSDENEVFIIGGAEIYRRGLAVADKLYLTVVKGVFPGDAYFPEYPQFTRILHQEDYDENGHSFSFIDLAKELPAG